MSSQIDPVTGLPVFVPPPIEEPPFLNPPFPWKDLTGIDVPPRATYYGADGIPTIATVAGMNPQDNRGQTVNTDGNHALLVSMSGGASGGGIVATKTFETTWGLHTPAIHSPMTIDRLCSVLFTAAVDMPVPAGQRNGDVTLWLATPTTMSPRVRIAWCQMVVGVDVDNPLKGWVEFNHDYTNPLDPCTMLGLSEGSQLALYGESSLPGDGTMYIALHYT